MALAAPVRAITIVIPDENLLARMTLWTDSVTVGGQGYAVPEQWRGRRVGSPDRPPPVDLRAVPPEFCSPSRSPMLRAGALKAFLAMAEAAAEDGILLRIQSGYRSVEEQSRLIEVRLEAGREFEEIVWGVAPPGYSEHMLGTVVDISLGGDYEENPRYLWLKENASRFGFRETYPPDPSGRFPWEPWHWRYYGPLEMDDPPMPAEDTNTDENRRRRKDGKRL